jgi:hypothetical protein
MQHGPFGIERLAIDSAKDVNRRGIGRLVENSHAELALTSSFEARPRHDIGRRVPELPDGDGVIGVDGD